MSKFIVKTEVEAVLLKGQHDLGTAAGIADLLPGSPHYFTDEGIVFSNDIEAETVPYGHYIVKERHGISAMDKELFEKISTPIVEGKRKINIKTVLRVKELKKYFEGYGPEFDEKEIWLGNGNGLSNECRAITPLDVDANGTHDFILETHL